MPVSHAGLLKVLCVWRRCTRITEWTGIATGIPV